MTTKEFLALGVHAVNFGVITLCGLEKPEAVKFIKPATVETITCPTCLRKFKSGGWQINND